MDDLKKSVARAQAGDLSAYGWLVRRFQNMAYGYAYAILEDFHLAEDAAQEAFLDAYRKLSDLETPQAFGGWLRRIVFKHCDRLTRRKQVETVPLEMASGLASKEPGADVMFEQQEIRARVAAMVESLPEKERMVTTLFYMNDCSLKEVAAFLEVPVSTVKNRLHASRKRLKERIMDMVGESLNAFPLPERFADVVVQMQFVMGQINPLGSRMRALSDGRLPDKSIELQRRLANGENRDTVKAEAFALVREASGRALGCAHYDVQLVAGLILDGGWVAEVASGEGKSLACYPPAYMAVLEGKRVHVVTANPYLARRDAAMAAQVFSLLGVTVGTAVESTEEEEPEARRGAYRCDLAYGSGTAFGFDCLRDSIREPGTPPLQGALDFAIINEVDSLLIDEGRTPLMISRHAPLDTERYLAIDRVARGLIERGGSLDASPFYRVDPAHRWQVEFTETGIEALGELAEEGQIGEDNVAQALRAHLLYQKDREYMVRDGRVVILDSQTGRLLPDRRWSDGLHQAIEVKEGVEVTPEIRTEASMRVQDYYRRYRKLAGMTGTATAQAEEFRTRYGMAVGVVPTRQPLNRVDHEDRVYAGAADRDEAVVEEVLHYGLELGRPVLVGVTSLEDSERLSKLFSERNIMHRMLSARCENAVREAEVIASAGRRGAVTIATEMAGRGADIRLGEGTVCAACRVPEGMGEDSRFPPGSVKCCIACTEYDASTGCAHCFKPTADPTFPKRGRTACREEVPCGLHVVGVGRHELRRMDDQLKARAGRQGEPGSSRFFLCREDELLRIAAAELRAKDKQILMREEVVEDRRISEAIARVQAKTEAKHSEIRRKLDEVDRGS